MREFERGLASFSPAGFDDFEASRKRRLEAALRRCARAASAADWVLGVFDANQDLAAFDTSGGDVDDRTALALLSMVPFPSTPGPVALNVPAEQAEKFPGALGISVSVGPLNSAAIVLLLRENAKDFLSPAADAIRSAIGEIAEELSDVYFDGQSSRTAVALDGPDAFFLLSSSYEVELEWLRNNGASGAFAQLVRPEERRLPTFLEQAVRRLTASWNFSRAGTCVPKMTHPFHGLALRVVPMRRNDIYIGVFLDVYDDGRELAEAASEFRISSREREVLHALLDGRSIAEIAASLNLAESTVNDHVARMIAKTNARNRIQMAATLLGWPAMRPRLVKNGALNGARAHDDEDREAEKFGSGEGRRARPSWRYHIGSGGPLHPPDWLP
jgi:DNA-binding CsgD family transcriptional regulator